jgi:hypothetical protein
MPTSAASGCCNRTDAVASADGNRYAREQSDRPGTAPGALNPRDRRVAYSAELAAWNSIR